MLPSQKRLLPVDGKLVPIRLEFAQSCEQLLFIKELASLIHQADGQLVQIGAVPAP
ncbi:hypothetical protein D3C74_323010 [compost metagenome]